MSGDYPAGVTNNDPHFDVPSVEDDEDLVVCEYCDTQFDASRDDGCPVCYKKMKSQQAYYGALFAREHRYTREEIEDCYSHPTEYQKRIGALRELGL